MIEQTASTYDVATIRADFPILQQENLIYLDNAASSQKPTAVIEVMNDYYRSYNANVHRGIHRLSERATEAYEGARRKVQKFIGAKSWREIIFTRGTTEGINLVAQTWGRMNLTPEDTVLLTEMEHHSNIVPWQMLAAEKGFTLCYIPICEDGTLDFYTYQRMLHENRVKLVAVTHCSNVLGTINPIGLIAKMAHDHGAKVLVDGAQSVPHLPVNVQLLDVDFLVFSGHKMLAPTGSGVLYAKRELLEDMPPWMGGGDMIAEVRFEGSTWNELPYKFEAGTPGIAEAVGLGGAVDYLSQLGMENIHQHEIALTAYAQRLLSKIPGLTLYGHAPERGSVLAFTLEGVHPHDIAQLLDHDGIAVRAGHHCAQPLHQRLGLNATARASFYLYDTVEEVDALAASLQKVRWLFKRGASHG